MGLLKAHHFPHQRKKVGCFHSHGKQGEEEIKKKMVEALWMP